MATFFEAMGSDPGDVADYTPAAAPVVSRMLELSTAHAPHPDAYREWIQDRGLMSRAEGDLIRLVDAFGTDPTSCDAPEWMQAILLHAELLRCTWIHFDADGPIDPGLPHWKW